MKHLLFILTVIVLISCGSNEEPIATAPPVREDPFLGFHITDSVGITNVIVVENRNDTTSVLISGIRKGKVWYGKFDKKTKNPIFEVEDSEPFDINKVVHLGYGEYKTFKVGDIFTFENQQVENTNYAFVTFVEGKLNTTAQNLHSYRLDFINNGKITKSLEKAYTFSPNLYKWFNSIVSQENDKYYVYSPNGDLLFESIYGSSVFYYTEAYSPYSIENCIAIVLSAGITRTVSIQKMNLKKEYREWSTNIAESHMNNKIENAVFNHENGKCNISFDILEYNGNRKTIKTTIDVETGKIIS